MHEDADPKDLPEDLRETAARLRDGRPSWTDAELDGIKLRAMKRVAGAARSRSHLARLARSARFTPQLAIGAALVALVVLSVGGAVKSNVGPLTLVSCTQYSDCNDALVITSTALSGPKSSSATLGSIVVTLESGGVPVAPTSNVLVTLTSNSSTGVFSSTSGGTTSSSLTVTIPAGSKTSAATPAYYADTTAGNPVITAAAITTPPESNTTVTSGTQAETIFGPATKLVFTRQPVGGVTEGTAFTTQPVVKVEDANGNVVTSDNASVTLAISSGGYTAGNGGTTQGNLACTNGGTNGLTATASSGVATFSGCNITGTAAAGTYTLTASRAGLTSTPASNSVAINAGNASKLLFTTQPAGGVTEGTAFSTSPKVSVEDSNGNLVTSDNGNVTLAISASGYTAGNGGTTQGTLACTNTGGLTATASGGVATFSGCNITGTAAAGTYTLTASRTGVTSAPASNNVVIKASTPTVLAFVNCSLPSSSNTTCSGQPIAVGNNTSMTFDVQTQDSSGNLSPPISTTTVTFTNSESTFTISSGSPATITSSAATSGTVTLHHAVNGTGDPDMLTATATGGVSLTATLTAEK